MFVCIKKRVNLLHRYIIISGFGNKWRKWLQMCWSSETSLLINGKAEDFFKSSRGLHQGDPLSPVILALLVDALTRWILEAQSFGLLEGFYVKQGSDAIPALHYADDILVFIHGDLEMAQNLKVIFLWFEAASRLQVNTSKSKIYQIIKVRDWEQITHLWSCGVGTLPDVYLGVPLAAGFKFNPSWQV